MPSVNDYEESLRQARIAYPKIWKLIDSAKQKYNAQDYTQARSLFTRAKNLLATKPPGKDIIMINLWGTTDDFIQTYLAKEELQPSKKTRNTKQKRPRS